MEDKTMNQAFTRQVLRQQNNTFKNTGGVSEENRDDGFHPAFYDTQSERAEISRFLDGSPAPFHLLDGVPNEWVTERDCSGKVAAIKSSIIAGFIQNGLFYTREQASCLCSQHG